MNRVITGSTGFVGQNLIKYIQDLPGDQTFLTRAELTGRSINKIRSADVVIHLAGKAHDLRKSVDASEYYEVNYELTKDLYDEFILSQAHTFIFVSSVKAVADRVEGILTEEAIPHPMTHYGKSKLLAEQYITNRPLPFGKKYYILRPCMIHGPGNKGNLNLLYNMLVKRLPYPLAAFRNSRSFLSVENLCFVIRELLNRDDIPSDIYNVADDQPLSTTELVQIMGVASGMESKLWNINPSIVKFLAVLGDFFPFPLSSERLEKLTENFVVSNSKLTQILKKRLPLSAQAGIYKTVESFSKAHNP